MKLTHDLARLSAAERRRIVDDFVDEVFAGLDPEPTGVQARMRAALPDLPDEPTDEQVQAWIELAELVADPDFRARTRAMAERGTREHAPGGAGADGAAMREAAEVVAREAGELERAVDPASPTAAPSATGSCWRS